MKNKTLPAFILLIGGIALFGHFTTWWVPAIWVIIISILILMPLKQSIIIGALSYGLVWVFMARWMSEHDDAEIISKTGELLGGLSHQLMIWLTLILGATTGGLSAWFGNVFGRWLKKESRND